MDVYWTDESRPRVRTAPSGWREHGALAVQEWGEMRWELYLQAKLRCGLYLAGSVPGPRSCHQQQTGHSHPMKSPLESPDLAPG